MKITTDLFIDILPEEGMELWNEELQIAAPRVSAPLNSDISGWSEREIVEEQDTDTDTESDITN